jgi:hypothetical protein
MFDEDEQIGKDAVGLSVLNGSEATIGGVLAPPPYPDDEVEFIDANDHRRVSRFLADSESCAWLEACSALIA